MKDLIETKYIKYLILFYIAIAAAIGTSWGVNLYKFTKCDFQAPWKGEIIHGIGLIPAASLVTVWFDDK